MTDIAREHAAEAADTLRAAALIDDPYLRDDAIWEAALRVRSAADHLRGRPATRCADISSQLEEGCEGTAEPPGGNVLLSHARTLERI